MVDIRNDLKRGSGLGIWDRVVSNDVLNMLFTGLPSDREIDYMIDRLGMLLYFIYEGDKREIYETNFILLYRFASSKGVVKDNAIWEQFNTFYRSLTFYDDFSENRF